MDAKVPSPFTVNDLLDASPRRLPTTGGGHFGFLGRLKPTRVFFIRRPRSRHVRDVFASFAADGRTFRGTLNLAEPNGTIAGVRAGSDG